MKKYKDPQQRFNKIVWTEPIGEVSALPPHAEQEKYQVRLNDQPLEFEKAEQAEAVTHYLCYALAEVLADLGLTFKIEAQI